MAFADFTIRAERRPCFAKGRKALFHRWADSARSVTPRGMTEDETEKRYQLWTVCGIVEYEDGIVDRAWPYEIQFTDTFNPEDYSWGESYDDEAWPGD